MKEGTFEWIFSYEEIQKYFEPEYTGISKRKEETKLLVIGCGTSLLSEKLREESHFSQTFSLDNDKDCIDHMKNINKYPDMKWFVYDMVEDFGRKQNNDLDKDENFDIIVDKGTFDAILVEGSVAYLLLNVFRLLRVDGIYILCTIFASDLVCKLMKILGFELCCYKLGFQESSGVIILCRKLYSNTIHPRDLLKKEKYILDEHYIHDAPLLTKDIENCVKKYYRDKKKDWITLCEAFDFIINKVKIDKASYPYEFFIADVKTFQLKKPDLIGADEMIEFLRVMQ